MYRSFKIKVSGAALVVLLVFIIIACLLANQGGSELGKVQSHILNGTTQVGRSVRAESHPE